MKVEWNEPFNRFVRLFELASQKQPKDPNAATLATVNDRGRPSARVVLVKGFDPLGFVFFTNYESQKGRELLGQKGAALCFYWPAIDEQVRVEGTVDKTTAAASDVYFASRPRESQLGAWASLQSQPLDDPQILQRRLQSLHAQYEALPIPRPPHWGGFVLTPDRIEFWAARESRLHERCVYVKQGQAWATSALFP